ncbi:MAG: AMP-dependent synthetase, partial [Mycobacterium sp.]|nr:AMP-dependent synthetase [Mycobacterium sp.]
MAAARIDLIHELVSSAAATAPDRKALICPDGTTLTFAEFDRQVGAVAAWVNNRTRRGDRVAAIADNGASYARLYYGVPRCGRILTLINQRLTPDEQITQLASAEPKVLLGDARYLAALPDVLQRVPSLD